MKDYVITVSYEGHISLGADSLEEATQKAKEIMLEETNPDMAKWLQYEVEEYLIEKTGE